MTKLSLIVIYSLLIAIFVKWHTTPLVTSSAVTYTKDAKPIFKERCAMCHNENMPDKNWMVYDLAFKNRDKIKAKLVSKEMPPGNSTNMTEKERQTIIDWVDGGGKK